MKTFPIIIAVFIILACGSQCSGQFWPFPRMPMRFNQQNADDGDPYEVLDPQGGITNRQGSNSESDDIYTISNDGPYSIKVVNAHGDIQKVDQDEDDIFNLVPYTEKKTFGLKLKGMILIECFSDSF